MNHLLMHRFYHKNPASLIFKQLSGRNIRIPAEQYIVDIVTFTLN